MASDHPATRGQRWLLLLNVCVAYSIFALFISRGAPLWTQAFNVAIGLLLGSVVASVEVKRRE